MMTNACCLAGSFHRHGAELSDALGELRDSGVLVLSPRDLTIAGADGPFLYTAGDRATSVKGIEDDHLAAICKAGFLWLVCPDGYVGTSAALEIGFAVGRGVPVLSRTRPSDITIREYVEVVP